MDTQQLPAPATIAARRVLCIDGYPDTAASEVELLVLSGYDARACTNGLAGLAAVRDFSPDACVMNVRLQGMDGYELARRIRAEIGDRVLLVAVTGWTGAVVADRLVAAGFDRVFLKPVDPGRLIQALDEGIALNRLSFRA
jgi:two-component system, OmpR family, response regulator